MRRVFAVSALVLLFVPFAPAKKKPPVPTQPPITKGCVTINKIVSHRMGFVTVPGLEGIARNGCRGPAEITMTIGYYAGSGQQFATRYEMGTVAPGTEWKFYHVPIMEAEQRALKSARIIDVMVMVR